MRRMETENVESPESPEMPEPPEPPESEWIRLFAFENLPGEPDPVTAVCD
jgi:hypothetical protein